MFAFYEHWWQNTLAWSDLAATLAIAVALWIGSRIVFRAYFTERRRNSSPRGRENP